MRRSNKEYLDALRAFHEEVKPILTAPKVERGIYSNIKNKYGIDLPLALARTLDWTTDFDQFSTQAIEAMKRYRRDLKKRQLLGEEPTLPSLSNFYPIVSKFHIGQEVVKYINTMEIRKVTSFEAAVFVNDEGIKVKSIIYSLDDGSKEIPEYHLLSKEEAYDKCKEFIEEWKGRLELLTQ